MQNFENNISPLRAHGSAVKYEMTEGKMAVFRMHTFFNLWIIADGRLSHHMENISPAFFTPYRPNWFWRPGVMRLSIRPTLIKEYCHYMNQFLMVVSSASPLSGCSRVGVGAVCNLRTNSVEKGRQCRLQNHTWLQRLSILEIPWKQGWNKINLLNVLYLFIKM